MLKYLIVQLDDVATSFCHYSNNTNVSNIMPLNTLKEAVIWSMKENLMVQFVLPNYPLPEEYYDVIDSIDHVCISDSKEKIDVNVFNGVNDIEILKKEAYSHLVLRLTKDELFSHIEAIKAILLIQPSVNITLRDIEKFTDEDYDHYQEVLKKFSEVTIERILSMELANVNLLTDRLSLNSINNCGAGCESITIAPDGSFYICPAFYFDGEPSVGNLSEGLNIPNEQLYKLDFAPICRRCDAYQCKRCVWLNKKTTLEINTPSRQQCVLAHLERNASRNLLNKLTKSGKFKTNISIPEIDYLDPYEILIKK
ncbi:MAG: CXXX repeat peptide maturase [Muribaculaceae bacterium]|nr:CXXX repeat peptide maturase [Muribaculaceae bacterium]